MERVGLGEQLAFAGDAAIRIGRVLITRRARTTFMSEDELRDVIDEAAALKVFLAWHLGEKSFIVKTRDDIEQLKALMASA